jgi:signal transduction histidine kinase
MYNKIQFKIIALITFITAIFIFGLFSFRHSAMKNVSSLLNDRVSEKDTLIKRIIDLKSSSLTSYIYDNSYWDEMLAFSKSKDEKWASENITPSMKIFNVDCIWLYDKEMNLVYTTNNFNDRTFKELPISKEELKSIVFNNPFSHFFINTGAGLMEISTGPLQPSSDVQRLTPPQGYYIGGRIWDSEYLMDLSVLSSSKVAVITNIRDSLIVDDLNSFEFINEIYLKDWNGRNLVKLRAMTESPVTKKFIAFTTYQFIGTIIFVILIITLISLFLFKIVNVPLKSITYSLEKESTEPINDLQKQKNEFGQIARLIKDFFTNKEFLIDEIKMRISAEEELIKKQNELILSKEKAEELSKLKSNLLANLSHEFRTPLSGIIGISELLKDEITGVEQLKLLNDITISGKRLHDTLNSVLLLAQFESSEIAVHGEMFNLTKEIKLYIDKYKYKADEKNLNLNIVFEDDKIIVNTDKDLLKQIFYNIFDNAVKFTDKGSVTVKLSSVYENSKKFAAIELIDTGIGISEKNINIIFDEFRQVSEGFTRKYEGTGLGLTLTKKLLEVMGGKITCNSKQGAGSTFTIFISAFAEIETELPAGAEKISKSESKHDLVNVLFVEDNPSNQFVFERFLHGVVNVDFASDGNTALNLVKNNKYGIIFMDINLGLGIDGIEVTKRIRSNESLKNIPVVALTGYAMEHDREYFLSNGFDYFVVKPFSKADLFNVINEINK